MGTKTIWTDEKDQRLLTEAFSGLIMEAIAENMGLNVNTVSSRLATLGLSLDKIRQWKRDKKTLKDLFDFVDLIKHPNPHPLHDAPIPQEPKTLEEMVKIIMEKQADLLLAFDRFEVMIEAQKNPQLTLISNEKGADHEQTA